MQQCRTSVGKNWHQPAVLLLFRCHCAVMDSSGQNWVAPKSNGRDWLPNAPLPESANYVRLCNWLQLASPTAPGDPDLDSPPPSWLHLLDHLTSLWICTWPGLYLLKDKSFGVLQCILRIPSRFPNSRLLTREAICRWGILISKDIKIPQPNYFMFLCSKLIWGVFWGHRIVSKSAYLIKNVYLLFLGKFDGPD